MSMIPATVTSPLASSVTGVLAALRPKRTVTPAGILIVLKLNTPPAGSGIVTFAVGLNAPSAPVLPLLKVCASADPVQRTSPAIAIPAAFSP